MYIYAVQESFVLDCFDVSKLATPDVTSIFEVFELDSASGAFCLFPDIEHRSGLVLASIGTQHIE